MAFKHTLKRGSTRPVLRYPLPGVDLTGATATFLMSPRPGQPPTVNAPAVVTYGALEYHWQHGDTSAAVMHYGEFEVVFPGGAIETFPNDDYIRIEVKQDVGDGGAVAPPAPITLTGALVESGADVASGAGAVVVTASGALAEVGSDTAAGTGTVTTPTPGSISLSAALIEAGADTASGTASVGITASAALVETGGDTAAGAGTVTDPAPQASALSYFAAPRNTHPWYAAATGPSAAFDAISNRTSICYQAQDPLSSNRYTRIAVYDHAVGKWLSDSVVGLGNIANDDHGVPAICITSDGYIVVFWGTHNSTLFYAVSKSPRTVADGWNNYSLTGVEYSYWRPIPRQDGGIDLFCRSRVTANTKMPLVYRQINMSAGVPTMGAEVTVVDFGSNSRFYSGDTFRGDDGRLWMVASRSDWDDVTRKNVYLFRIDPGAGVVLTLGGASKPMPLSNTDANDYALYMHSSSASITSNIHGMARDAAGRIHISFNTGQAAGIGGTENLSPQEVFHMIVAGDVAGAPFKVADLDQRYEAARCIPLAGGAMGIYFPSMDGVRGGGILRRVIPAGSDTPGPVETIIPYDPTRYGISEVQMVLNAHPDFRVAFGEIAPTDQDVDAKGHRLWAHGDSGFVTRPVPSADLPLPAGSFMAFDMTDALSLAASTDGTGAVSSDLDAVRFIRDLSGNGRHLTHSGTAKGVYLRTDETDRSLQIGANNRSASTSAFLSTKLPLIVGGEFSITGMVVPLKTAAGESILIGFDTGAMPERVFTLRHVMPERTLRFAVFKSDGTGIALNAPTGIFNVGDTGFVSIVGLPERCDIRLNGQVVLTLPQPALSVATRFSLSANAAMHTATMTDARWRRLIARSGAVSQAQIEADEAWVQRLANLT